MKDIEKEVVDVLTENPDNIGFEELQSEQYSPLNQAVIEKDIGGANADDWNIWKHGKGQHQDKKSDTGDQMSSTSENAPKEGFSLDDAVPAYKLKLDAPEQEIGSDNTSNNEPHQERQSSQQEEEFELPTATAKQAADTILGMTNNVLAVGGGFFVKIRKHKEFYDFDEIVELIDEQNEKNVQRIKLDKEDKAMLKPLIVAILKRKAKKLTPEQQLMGAVLSILMKKAQVVMEVRAENEILFDRILDIVREEKGYSDQDVAQEDDDDRDILDTAYEEINGKPEPEKGKVADTLEYETSVLDDSAYDDEPTQMDSVVEVAEEEIKK
ncbi:hypothetical protein [uncultured Aquimarina sp.]|uniref:hypothetical protein n=1 Tax=uncultured Aquimarina sp. TaxID=575652 RepID=UPI0026377F24|nr:hypothetical protein [uncultured Aquimarina sp.]